MERRSYYIINGITVYRLIAAPVLVALIFTGNRDWFKWLLAISFFTDAIDGFLARRYGVTSIFGARLDSIADDLTVMAAMLALYYFHPDFLYKQLPFLLALLSIFLIHVSTAWLKFRNFTSYHTYLAKLSAVLQGSFLILAFFLPEVPYWLFYTAIICTALDLVEEIIITQMIPKLQSNVKGLYWVLRKKL